MALSPIGFLLISIPVGAALLIGSGTVRSPPARRLTTGIAMVPLVPLGLVFLIGIRIGLTEDIAILIGLVGVFILCVRLHWLVSAMQWRHAWLAHLLLVCLNGALAIALFIYLALMSSFGSGGHH